MFNNTGASNRSSPRGSWKVLEPVPGTPAIGLCGPVPGSHSLRPRGRQGHAPHRRRWEHPPGHKHRPGGCVEGEWIVPPVIKLYVQTTLFEQAMVIICVTIHYGFLLFFSNKFVLHINFTVIRFYRHVCFQKGDIGLLCFYMCFCQVVQDLFSIRGSLMFKYNLRHNNISPV